MAPFRVDSPDQFFFDRCDWFRVDVLRNRHGSWAVVLVLDEGYALREDAEGSATYFAGCVSRALLDVFNRYPKGMVVS